MHFVQQCVRFPRTPYAKKYERTQRVNSDHHITAYMSTTFFFVKKDGFRSFSPALRSLVTADWLMLRKNYWMRDHLSTKSVVIVTFLPFLHRCLLFVASIKLGVVWFQLSNGYFSTSSSSAHEIFSLSCATAIMHHALVSCTTHALWCDGGALYTG